MLDMDLFGKLLKENGCSEFVGVPCSYLSPMINYAINDNSFIMSNNEGDAVAIASGISISHMSLNNKFGVVLMQNSGLSNALSPLTSLNYTFKIPILGFVSLRGERDKYGKNTDEPQHELLGVITDKLLKVCDIEYDFLDNDFDNAKKQLLQAINHLKNRKSYFFIVKNNVFQDCKLNNSTNIKHIKNIEYDNKLEQSMHNGSYLPKRMEILENLHNFCLKNKIALLATTGKTGRELYEINDTDNQLYMVGSMGCVSSMSLGISLQNNKKVIAVDGDSALLMRLGALTTNAYYSKLRNIGNFCHIVLDNEAHDSTGGQFNLSPCANFPKIAKECSYERIFVVTSKFDLENALNFFLTNNAGGAIFIYIKIAKGSKKNLGRPTISPQDVAFRMANFLMT